jgi:protein SCO1/2
MKMGYNRPLLQRQADGARFSGQASLPVCITGSMEWQATLLVDDRQGAGRRAVPLRQRQLKEAHTDMRTNRFLIALIALLSCRPALSRRVLGTAAAAPDRQKIAPHERLPPGTAPRRAAISSCRDHRGTVALADYRGKVVLIYFGYTWCPDVCPTSLSLLAQAIADLAPDERERVQAIFISVDPERDTPRGSGIRALLPPGKSIGLSGSREQIAAVANAYGSSYQKQPRTPRGNYAVDHSSATYVVDPQGRLAGSLPHAASPAQIVAFVRQQLAAANTR